MGAVNPGQAAYRLTFQLSPVIMTGGVASLIPGGMLPLISISQAINFTFGLLSGAGEIDLDNFFANFQPVAGATLIDNQIGTYPFANQSVAANAIIAMPLKVSLLMIAPARDTGGYATKLATMMAMQATFAQHNQQGGTYTVATPSFFYTDCIMTGMQDVTPGQSKQVQMAWRFDFTKPLVTLQDAAQAQNALMSKITNGTMFNGAPAWSGLGPVVGLPWTAAAPGVVPAAVNPAGAGNAPFPPDDL